MTAFTQVRVDSLLIVILAMTSAAAFGHAQMSSNSPGQNGSDVDSNVSVAQGEIVAELGNSVMYIFQARNGEYWFGSNDRGVYRYDGRVIVNFAKRDGLCSERIRGIQEDKAGSIYFTTYEGISKFDGKSFTTLPVSISSSSTDWKKQSGDLWFVGPPDAGVVFRYDGNSLYRLEFPKTKLGDEHFAKMPRSKFPNAIYSPYDMYCILNDSKGNLWFGSTCIGVCRYDGTSFDWLTDKTFLEAPVWCILEDNDGNFWFTYSGDASFSGFRTVKGFGKLQDQSEGHIVDGMSIIEDKSGKLWTAGLAAGAYKYDGNQRSHYPIQEGSLAIEVSTVFLDNRGDIWLGTHNGGAYKFNRKSFEKIRQ